MTGPWLETHYAEVRVGRADFLPVALDVLQAPLPFRAIDLNPPASGPEIAIFLSIPARITQDEAIEMAKEVVRGLGIAPLAARLVRA
jgi:hypothetical protein